MVRSGETLSHTRYTTLTMAELDPALAPVLPRTAEATPEGHLAPSPPAPLPHAGEG